MEHEFTPQIKEVLVSAFGKHAETVFDESPLLQYLNIKTRSASRGSKARASFANIYAVYVLSRIISAKATTSAEAIQTMREPSSPTCFVGRENCLLEASYKTTP